ncbi:hypothetical protein LJR029_005133 [Caballeronia sp. LjRoot29]|uniref:hypothetical protein n=1 Tax=Caballeronia sp. LjRoot29 TaxID=3342315 RepID=UPI003ED0C4AB
MPPDSAEWRTRKSLLTYYGDTLKQLELTANMIEAKQLDDKVSTTLVQLLVQKVDHERADAEARRDFLARRLCNQTDAKTQRVS